MIDLYKILRPALFQIDPEEAHKISLKTLKSGIVKVPRFEDESLHTTVWGMKFRNPVGLAAGYDKNAEVIAPALRLGFGFVETGTVTPQPQLGNDLPRIFRDPGSAAIINRLGFPNAGMKQFRKNYERFVKSKKRPEGIVGINIGMNKDQPRPIDDYRTLIRAMAPLADYITINVSSPNTKGLRDLQNQRPLFELLTAIKEDREESCSFKPVPILVKLSPDLEFAAQEEIALTVSEARIDGLIVTNTTLSRPPELPIEFAIEQGGLSGAPLRGVATQAVRNFYRLTGGKIPIIGVGGISNGQDAYEKIRAGASLVQIYSALVFHGPGLVNDINKELAQLLHRDGFTNIAQAVGLDAGISGV